MAENILVTGGAGFIGSHMVKMLGEAGFFPVTLDDLSNGHKDAVLEGAFIEGNIGDSKLLNKLFEKYNFKAVMHFASFILVGESMNEPEKYHHNNVINSQILAENCANNNVPLIFSSTAAVFGDPEYVPIDEKHPKNPVNVYGETKFLAEQMLEDLRWEQKLNYGVLRYFNAAGADPEGKLGERHEPETHLIPLIIEAALGKRDLKIFGNDYDTIDGTCVRDYIHIVDLCDAHIKLLEYLLKIDHSNGIEERCFNLGNGHGYSVMDVIKNSEKIIGKEIIYKIEDRREGDPAILIADGSMAKEKLGWKPKYPDIETMIQHAWNWFSS